MGKAWVEMRAEIPISFSETAANFLIEQGSPGITEEKVRGSGGKRARLIAYFAIPGFRSKLGDVRRYLAALCRPRRCTFRLQSKIIRKENWAEAWKANFKPLRITRRLVVQPPWEEYAPKREEVAIKVDPGMAFGTGTHPSTQMCLRALETWILTSPYPPSVLDVGTGSGILAIAARKLGAGRILAVDTDPAAIDSARKNAVLNEAGGIDFQVGSLEGLRQMFKIVLANLLPQEILGMADSLPKRVSAGGVLVLSGLLRSQKGEILSAFEGRGFKMVGSWTKKGWACLVLERAVGKKTNNPPPQRPRRTQRQRHISAK